METVIHIGGRFVAPGADLDERVVSLLDHGYLLGDGVFATMRGYRGVCFRAERHLRDLRRGAELFGIELPTTPSALVEVANESARRTGAEDAYVRVTLTRGRPGGPPTLSVIARRMELPSDADYANGVSVVTVGPRRIPPACLDGSVKTTSYGVQVLARREAEAKKAREGIMLAIDGTLACGTMANLFVVVGDTLLTPSLESGCRAGITRGAVLELASSQFAHVREERLSTSVLEHADEVFLTSTRIECLPVADVDGQPVGRGRATANGRRFARTQALREAFTALVAAETAA